ncbi:signal transduction histidine kinase/FixJ family two-component response regulator/HPt (histidine-containing phosphotransfer) domain-containing protein [Catalinimonas alkaloidigena]|uniref:hybrid sensor histidine kinase/response regulator n=1 Tax=Catalinimonas alkaloidigena TaxID=1075417 RepID=UPI002404B156|nr:ATP-binding protein [Catalinimonas alkaloidigena]MDF9795898.1 signal transduction histidine kinase/FixJ family two-component response regulator/HPt (histidine-containing phosphotransfer) domain-containing protein [Catalinimonas alkaloidigena]
MRMNRSFYLKSKVLLGFGFILIAIAVASGIAYNSYDQLSYAVQTISNPDAKLQQIDSIMFMVDRSENSLQEYTITKSARKLREYDSRVLEIRSRVQALKEMSAFDESELDSILALINAKLVSMDDFMRIKEQRDAFQFYDKALAQLNAEAPQKKDSTQLAVASDTVNANDNAPNKVEPNRIDNEADKKWLQNLKKSVVGFFSKKDQETDSTSLATAQDSLSVDTTSLANLSVDSVRQMLTTLKSEQAATEKYLDKQELKYLSNNAEVMNRINDLISRVKQAQQEKYQAQSAEARNILQSSLSRLGIILLVALGSTFIFIYLIFSDIAKSDSLKLQLEKAKAQAEQLASVKEDFLANMSHEIRTPLTAILGFTHQLKKTSMKKTQEEYLSAVDSSSSHLLALVNDILDFSKIEAGQLNFEHQPFDIKELIEQVQRDMSFQADKKGLQIHIEIEGENYRYLNGDAFRLRQVLYNLVSNAIKFTEEGGVIIRCKLKSMSEGKVKAQLEVIDTGIGIPQEKQQHVFEAFVQSDVSDTRKYGGTGLGLSISKRIVESQGGEMALESEVGEGATFYVALPFDVSSKEEVESTVKTSDSSREFMFSDSKILIIDDDQLNTKLLTLLMEKRGVQSYIAHSGEEGLQILKDRSVDLVFTDLQMPGMHGDEVAAHIRASEKADLIIVAFTARVTEDKHYFEDRGFTDVLHKPFNEKEVYQLLDKYLLPIPETSETASTINGFQEVESLDKEANDKFYTLDNIVRFIGDDQDALLGFIESFSGVLQDSSEKMKNAIESGDYEAVAYHAHKLFPNIQQLQVQELTPLLRKLEHQGQQLKDGEVENKFPWKEKVSEVLKLTEKLLAALNQKKELLKTQVS